MEVFHTIFSILNRKQKIGAIYQCFLMVVAMFFELLSIGMLMPIIAVISSTPSSGNQPILQFLIDISGSSDKRSLLIIIMFFFVGVYALKLIFMTYVTWANYKYVFSLQTFFSAKLFKGYLTHSLSFHIQRNSAQLIQNSINIVASTTGVLVTILLIITESITSLAIIIFLIYVQPQSVVFLISIFLPTMFLFNLLTKRKLLKLGESYQKNEGNRIQYLQQGLGAIKDIKVLGRENYFFNKYQAENINSANAQRNQQTLQALPRFYLEFFAVLSIGLLVAYLSYVKTDFSFILTTLGLFGGSAFRLMPSLNRISGALQYIRFSSPILNTLKSELLLIDLMPGKKVNSQITFTSKIELRALSFKHNGSQFNTFTNLNLVIPKGKSIGIIGKTGEGKSTLIDLLLGLLSPSDGQVLVDDIDISENVKSWQSIIGYVPQNIFLTDDTIRNNIAFGIDEDLIDDNALENAIKLAQIEELVASQPNGLSTFVGERGVRLSGGEKQRIGIARALYNNPQVIVLDEATSSLDIKTEADVMKSVDYLSELKTVIIVAHRLSTIQKCDKVYRLKSSTLVDITHEFII